MRNHMMLLITLATRRRHRCHNKPNRKYSKKSIKYSLNRRGKQTNKQIQRSIKCRPLNKHNFQREREYIVCPEDLHTYLDVIIFKYIEKEH